MTHNQFDNEYYVMNVDGKNNHPILAWGKTNYDLFLEAEKIDENSLNTPLQILFRKPYITNYEMPDLLMLSANFSSSSKFKNIFEKAEVYGIQFIAVEIAINTSEIIKGFNAIHIWNQLSAIDKNNYEGSPVDRFGTIPSLVKFSLDEALLNGIPVEERLIFLLSEDSTMILVHQTIVEAIQAAGLTGMRFWKVSEWDENAMFR